MTIGVSGCLAEGAPGTNQGIGQDAPPSPPDQWIDEGPVREEAVAAVERAQRRRTPTDLEPTLAAEVDGASGGGQRSARLRERLLNAYEALERERFGDARRMANALVRVGHEFQPLVPPRGSVAAHVQAAVPDCRIVAAFHHLPAKELGHLGAPIDSDVLICGDDPEAVREVSDIVGRIPGCRPLDAGELSNATAIEAFTAVLLQLNVRYRTRVAPKLTGIRDDA